ncbi:MAG: ATP-grasp domain-containing protein [Candidatus Zixiibacteriota bacterium]
MASQRVIVYGTTADYIELIARRYPGRALFIVSPAEKKKIKASVVADVDTVVCDLADLNETTDKVRSHMAASEMTPSGLVGFDCETLQAASRLALRLGLPFPSPESIEAVQDKHRSKILWTKNGLYAPKSMRVLSLNHLVSFFNQLSRPLVVKPILGTGSNYQFICSTKYDCIRTFHYITTVAGKVKEDLAPSMEHVPDIPFIAEEFVRGREYSCDFVIENGDVRITRLAKKILMNDGPLGTTRAYTIPADLPGKLTLDELREILAKAMISVRIDRAFAMVDFIINNDRIYLLEITPRPGGDCLPDLVRASCDIDTLDLALSFAEGKRIETPPFSQWRPVVGLRLFAQNEGVITKIDCSDITDIPKIVKIKMNCLVGDEVTLPPQDYTTWLLATVVFYPDNVERISQECDEIGRQCHFTIEEPTCKTAAIS